MRRLMLALGLAGLAGCATAPSPFAGYDTEYMAKVEKGARLGGAQLVWVQPPLAKAQQVSLQTPAQN